MKTNFNLKTTDTEVLRNLAQDIHIELNARMALKRTKAIKDFQAAFAALQEAHVEVYYRKDDVCLNLTDGGCFWYAKALNP